MNVYLTDLGFRVLHPQFSDSVLADCGVNYDRSIFLSVNTDESPPVIRFFRMNYTEMAKFSVQAYARGDGPSGSRNAIIHTMRKLDREYNDTALRQMMAVFLSELEANKEVRVNG
ncbi:hypothetical protein [Parahaliea mediterranea]|uniref:Uncharacterized protein n=1 Tax=Parahaliea mediterranea TaxID=651086 RepID=A0A939DFJ3_9GAMM|nr:hypothetical protein [Parahaliea mediterranea]MBN7796961.1 hypothetical protein [Parahaliea mediterranea]